MWCRKHNHDCISTWTRVSYHRALQSLPAGPTLSLSLSPGTVLALSCFLGLAGPGRTDPDPSFSCSPTEMPSGWCEWLPQQRPGDLQPAGTKVTPPQRFALSLPSFHQPAGELFILYNLRGTNLLHKHPPTPQKKLHTQFTDIITCNEKINVSAWTAKINSSQMSSDISQGCGSYTGEDGGTSCSDFTRPGKTGSDHDWMRNKWINWFLTHVARRCHILKLYRGLFATQRLVGTYSYQSGWR